MEQGTTVRIFHHQRASPTEGAGYNKQSILEFWSKTNITMYIMKLHGARNFNKFSSSSKGVNKGHLLIEGAGDNKQSIL